MEPITIPLPIYIQVNAKTNFALNLNQYRNAHYHILNKAKTLFEEAVKPLLTSVPPMTKLKLTYTLFFGSKRAVDTANVCSIVDKFFSDTLVNNQLIPDDNNNVIDSIDYRFGGIDIQNPRVDVTISDYEVTEKEEDMRIILVQSEIEEAIKAYVHQQITLREGQDIDIDFKMTRGDDGATAEVNVINRATVRLDDQTAKAIGEAAKTPPKIQTSIPAGSLTVGSAGKITSTEFQKSQDKPAESVQEEVPSVPVTPTTKTPVEGSTPGTTPASTEVKEEPKTEEPKQEPKEETAPAAPSKSLFANLSKPVNS